MGLLSEDITKGRCCENCGNYFTDEHGYRVVCTDCYNEMPAHERIDYKQATHEEL